MTDSNDTPRSEPRHPHRHARAKVPQTATEWREALRKEELPPELAELPYLRRRRAKKHWRSAIRDERSEWIRQQRRNTPTPLVVPVLALLLAAAVLIGSWLWPDHDDGSGNVQAKPTPTAQAPQPEDTEPASSPTAGAPDVANTPDAIARAFTLAYTLRRPVQDADHTAAVERAAPYASTPLIENLKRHDDRDFNKLVAAQATEAKPTKVRIGQPSDAERPAVDTSIRVYRQADVTLSVTGTDPYTYTRHLTLEIARADAASTWMVTRVLGLEE
ncbi:hypothetical protein [Streptomyces europaeiscabiei]|uniref:hypothetical protein n=1 Tax=Streptomyces europaeiscabiei TaxID=146819 RepID=UPI0038F65ACC